MTAAVDTQHPQYEHKEYEWRQLRDTQAGMSNIKRSADLYLPIPSAMLTAKTQASIVSDDGGLTTDFGKAKELAQHAPWWHPIPAYSAYLQRARFPDLVANCMMGFVGIATKKAPVVELPPSLAHLEQQATKDNVSLVYLYNRIFFELLLLGRYEILVDVQDDGKIVFVTYNAESFINWKKGTFDGDEVASLGVFEECSDNADDLFSHDPGNKHRVLSINSDGEYESSLYVDGEIVVEKTSVPSLKGKTLPFIPLVVANATRMGLDVGASPMIGISDIAISIYQKDADMSQSEFLTCNPMLVITGADDNDVPDSVGSSVAWVLPNAESNVFYAEPKSSCLGHMKERVSDLREEAMAYGGALLGGTRKAAEATETVRMRQESSGATLKTVATMAEEAINRALKLAAFWANEDPDSVSFVANKEFSEVKLTAQEQTALLQSWMNGGVSQETYLQNLKEASIIPEDRTIEEEQSLIRTQSPNLVGA